MIHSVIQKNLSFYPCPKVAWARFQILKAGQKRQEVIWLCRTGPVVLCMHLNVPVPMWRSTGGPQRHLLGMQARSPYHPGSSPGPWGWLGEGERVQELWLPQKSGHTSAPLTSHTAHRQAIITQFLRCVPDTALPATSAQLLKY